MLNKNKIKKIIELRNQGLSYREIEKITRIHKNTIMKYSKNEINDQNASTSSMLNRNEQKELYGNPYTLYPSVYPKKTTKRSKPQGKMKIDTPSATQDLPSNDSYKMQDLPHMVPFDESPAIRQLKEENAKLKMKIEHDQQDTDKQKFKNEVCQSIVKEIRNIDEPVLQKVNVLEARVNKLENKKEQNNIHIGFPILPLSQEEIKSEQLKEQKIPSDKLIGKKNKNQCMTLQPIEDEQNQEPEDGYVSDDFGYYLLRSIEFFVNKWNRFNKSPYSKYPPNSQQYLLGISKILQEKDQFKHTNGRDWSNSPNDKKSLHR